MNNSGVLSGRKRVVLGIETDYQINSQLNQNSNKLEKLIKDMLSKDKITNSNNIKNQTIEEFQNADNLAQDAVNLSSFLDVKIQGKNQNQDTKSPLLFKDEPTIIKSENLLEQTIAAQRNDIIALQEIEKSKKEIQKRIKERYSVLRSISRKANPRKPGSMIPQDIIIQQRILSNSNVRPSTTKYDFHPYHQTAQSLINMAGVSKSTKRVRRQNKTTYINPTNPSQIDFYSGRITQLFANSIIQHQSPTVLSKTSTIQNNTSIVGQDPSQTQPSIMSNKKISRIQRKKIVIHDNFNTLGQNINNRDVSPMFDYKLPKQYDLITMKNSTRLGPGNYSQLKQRPQKLMLNQSTNLRSASSTLRHNRTRSGNTQMYLRKLNVMRQDQNEDQNSKNQLLSISPQTQDKSNTVRADSVPLDPQIQQKYTNLLNLEQPITMFSDEYDVQRSKENQSKRDIRASIHANMNFNIRQKLNFRYVPGEDQQQYGTIDNYTELEETKRDIMNSNHIKDQESKIFVNDSIIIKNSIPIQQYLNTQELCNREITVPNVNESVFNTPSNNQELVFSSNIINPKIMNLKNGWRDQGIDSDSAGMSKTTLSTQRPMLSGGGVTGLVGALQQHQANKLTSKVKLISYQRGRFSSDSSFIKLRQTQQNQPIKHSTIIDGEDSQCKFEGDLEDQKIRQGFFDTDTKTSANINNYQRISHAPNNNLIQLQIGADMSVGQIQEEEEYIEDEDSKKSNLKIKEQSVASIISTNRILTAGQHNRKNYVENQSVILDESQCNLLNSNRTDMLSVNNNKGRYVQDTDRLGLNKNILQNKWLLENDESQQILQTYKKNPNEVLHSDDEIEIRRGLEPSTNRSMNPRDPEFLRQSTHSLLGIKKNNGNNDDKNSNTKNMIVDDYDDEELRAQLDIDLDNEQIILNDSQDLEPPSRLQFNENSYENYLKNADNFIN